MGYEYDGCQDAISRLHRVGHWVFPNPHLSERPDRGDPAIDFVWFRKAASAALL